jgi:hypothetical protein
MVRKLYVDVRYFKQDGEQVSQHLSAHIDNDNLGKAILDRVVEAAAAEHEFRVHNSELHPHLVPQPKEQVVHQEAAPGAVQHPERAPDMHVTDAQKAAIAEGHREA